MSRSDATELVGVDIRASSGENPFHMSRPAIDLRSDTVTRPTPAMRKAMAEAEVGDDVYNEDPTVKGARRRTAELFGMEDAIFMPSGTMTNQIAIGVHVAPGDEVLCDVNAHVYVWEGGNRPTLRRDHPADRRGSWRSSVSNNFKGRFGPTTAITRTRLVSLENTQNRGGGRVHPLESVAEISGWTRSNGLAMHLDGARIMNAVVASGVAASEWLGTSIRSPSVSPRGPGPRSARPWLARPP